MDGDDDGEADKEEGASFRHEGIEVKACFKCGAKDYKSCPCDNLKNAREKEQKRQKQKGSNHLLIGTEDNTFFRANTKKCNSLLVKLIWLNKSLKETWEKTVKKC